MKFQTSFDILSSIVEHQEASGWTVKRVEATTCDTCEGALDIRMDIAQPLCAASPDGPQLDLSPESATLTEDGAVSVEFTSSALILPAPVAESISATVNEIRRTDDGLHLSVDCAIKPPAGETHTAALDDEQTEGESAPQTSSTIKEPAPPPAPGPAEGTNHTGQASASPPDLEAARTPDLPPYEDFDYLQRLYDVCDTFEEMSDRIEMDVSSETVRRYMMDAGIHEPTTYDTETGAGHASENGSVSEAESTEANTAEAPSPDSVPEPDVPVETLMEDHLLTDGLGLPEDLQIADVIDAVTQSGTLYDVQRQLDLDQRSTRDLLKQLNLLDLVLHRLSDAPNKDVSYEKVTGRIRQCAPNGHSHDAPT